MLARNVACPTAVVEAAHSSRRPIVERRAIGRFLGQASLDISPDDLGEREATLAGLSAQATGLLLCELNLGADHELNVSTS